MIDVINHARYDRWFIATYCVVLVLALGILKAKVGFEPFVLAFFLIPIYLATFRISRFMGMAIGVLSALTWLAALALVAPSTISENVLYWNITTKVGFILISTLFLGILKDRLDREHEWARTDPLTNISNRREFFEMTGFEINRFQRYKRAFTVASLDVDGFKKVNDSMGHAAGDTLLCLIADTMKRHLRNTDVVSRIGGDEFAILLPETDRTMATNTLFALREKLLSRAHREGFAVTFSIGALTYHEQPPSVLDVMQSVDELLYAAKNSGKDRIIFSVKPAQVTLPVPV